MPGFAGGVYAVALTTAAVAFIGWRFAGLPIAAAIALGAIVAPPDAAAAAAVLKELRLPQRIGAILQGESLLNDATALLIYRAAVAMAVGSFSLASDGPLILLSAAGSLIAGYVLARLYLVMTSRIRDAASSTVLQFVGTFAVWLLAERLTLSPIITVVIYAMALAQAVPRRSSARLRISSYSVWETAIFVVNVLAFVLMGLQARHIIERLTEAERLGSLLFGLSVLGIVIATRIAWIAAYRLMIETARRWFNADLGARDPRGAILVSWSGMRGLVTLATAFALPLDFPGRDLIVLCAFCVVLGTLVIQGLTLRPLLHVLDFKDDGTSSGSFRRRGLRSCRRRSTCSMAMGHRQRRRCATNTRPRTRRPATRARRKRRPSTISSGCERSKLNGRCCIVCARNDKSATTFFTGSRKSSIGPSSTRRRPGAFNPSSAETASGKRRGPACGHSISTGYVLIAVTVSKLRQRSHVRGASGRTRTHSGRDR
jgi:NhaP-type Na+/H+ or K+/H+ antiporter